MTLFFVLNWFGFPGVVKLEPSGVHSFQKRPMRAVGKLPKLPWHEGLGFSTLSTQIIPPFELEAKISAQEHMSTVYGRTRTLPSVPYSRGFAQVEAFPGEALALGG